MVRVLSVGKQVRSRYFKGKGLFWLYHIRYKQYFKVLEKYGSKKSKGLFCIIETPLKVLIFRY